MNKRMYSYLIVASLLLGACGTSESVTSKTMAFSNEEQQQLMKKASGFLATQQIVIGQTPVAVQATMTGSDKIIYDEIGHQTKNLKDIQTIKLQTKTLEEKEGSIYFDEQYNVLGYIHE